MKGVVELENMEFFARHGCFEEERVIGNMFLVDLYMETEVDKPMQTDNIEDALNYQLAYNVVKKEMNIPSNLLEHVAGRIIRALYAEFPQLKKVRVKVSKQAPPIGGKLERSSVTLEK